MAQIERIEAKSDEWVAVTVDWLAKKVNEFVASEGVCLLGLSGGTPPCYTVTLAFQHIRSLLVAFLHAGAGN